MDDITGHLGLPKIRIICGTGRCGTWSWYRIMQAQSGMVQSSHEGLPFTWEVDRANFFWLLLKCMVDWIGTPIWCNASFAWIRYMGMVMTTFKEPRVICLKRDRDELVASFMKHWQYENYWTEIGSDHWDGQWPVPSFQHPEPELLAAMWPKYDLPKEDAIAAYYDEYYAIADYWAQRLPDAFMIVDFKESLNTFEGQDRVLEFFGIPPKLRRHFVGVRLNDADAFRGMLYKEKQSVHGTIRIHEEPTLVGQEIRMSLRRRSGALRRDLSESMGETDTLVPGGNGDGWLPATGGDGYPLPETMGYGEHDGQREADEGDVVHGESEGADAQAGSGQYPRDDKGRQDPADECLR